MDRNDILDLFAVSAAPLPAGAQPMPIDELADDIPF